MTWPAIRMEIFLVITLAKSINDGLSGKNLECSSFCKWMFLPVCRVARQDQQLWTVVLHMVRCVRDFLNKSFVIPSLTIQPRLYSRKLLRKEGLQIPTWVAFIAVRIV